MSTDVSLRFPLERAHNAANDLDWLPAHIRAMRWVVTGALWGGMASTVALITVLTHGHFFLYWGKGLLAMAVGGYYAADRAARGMMKRRVARLARGTLNLSSVGREPDGELWHVRGRVRAQHTVPSVLGAGQGVYRRVTLQYGGERVIHEVAVDFTLLDEQGEQVLVQVAGARLLAPEPRRVVVDAAADALLAALAGPELPAGLARALAERRQLLARGRPVDALLVGELLVAEGDQVELVGYKGRAIDVTMERLERELPLRTMLRSGRELPLLIAPVPASPGRLMSASQAAPKPSTAR